MRNLISTLKHKIETNDAYRELFDIALFMIITIGLHLLWWEFLWKIKSLLGLDVAAKYLTQQVYFHSSQILHFLGVEHTAANCTLQFKKGYIQIIETCSGLKQLYQISFLILLSPGYWKNKLWYIPLGMVVLYITNVLRIVILAYILLYFPQHWDFAHTWILRPFFYVVIFLLWLFWTKKLSHRYGHSENTP